MVTFFIVTGVGESNAPQKLIHLLLEFRSARKALKNPMKRKRHKPEEIVKKLREAASLLAGGAGVEDVCKKLGVSPPTYFRWKEQYSGAEENTVKRLKELEKENSRLKKLVAEQALDIDMLKEVASGKW